MLVAMIDLAIITGASRGIGAALVDVARSEGARVATLSRRPADGEHLAADLATDEGWRASAAWMDRLIAASHGQTWLFHMAGALDPIGFAGETDVDAYRRLVLVDAVAPQVLGASFVGSMRRHERSGGLVLASSGAATTVYPGWSAYCAAKAAVDAWVRVVAEEQRLRGTGLRVLAVVPGSVETGMQELIRGTSSHDFPTAEKFRLRHERGEVRTARWAAETTWAVATHPASGSEPVVDLKSVELPPAGVG